MQICIQSRSKVLVLARIADEAGVVLDGFSGQGVHIFDEAIRCACSSYEHFWNITLRLVDSVNAQWRWSVMPNGVQPFDFSQISITKRSPSHCGTAEVGTAEVGFVEISTPLGFRDHLILWLFLDTGIRLSELCTLTLDRVFIRLSSAPYIKVLGKGRKEREVGLHDTTAELLWKYIHMYRHPHDITEQTVFINRYGKPLIPTGVGQIILDMKKRAGIEGVRVSPYTLRHTFARTYLARGGDLGKLSHLMGHSKVRTTEHYLKNFSSCDARIDQSDFSLASVLRYKKSRRGFQKNQHENFDAM